MFGKKRYDSALNVPTGHPRSQPAIRLARIETSRVATIFLGVRRTGGEQWRVQELGLFRGGVARGVAGATPAAAAKVTESRSNRRQWKVSRRHPTGRSPIRLRTTTAECLRAAQDGWALSAGSDRTDRWARRRSRPVPGAIAVGSEGDAYRTPSSGGIARLTPAGEWSGTAAQQAVPEGAVSPAAGGGVWFVQRSDRTIDTVGRISAAGQVNEFPIPSHERATHDRHRVLRRQDRPLHPVWADHRVSRPEGHGPVRIAVDGGDICSPD